MDLQYKLFKTGLIADLITKEIKNHSEKGRNKSALNNLLLGSTLMVDYVSVVFRETTALTFGDFSDEVDAEIDTFNNTHLPKVSIYCQILLNDLSSLNIASVSDPDVSKYRNMKNRARDCNGLYKFTRKEYIEINNYINDQITAVVDTDN